MIYCYLRQLSPREEFAVLGNGGDIWTLVHIGDMGAIVQKRERRIIHTQGEDKTFLAYNRQTIALNTLVRRIK